MFASVPTYAASNVKLIVNSEIITPDSPPVVINGSTLVSLKSLSKLNLSLIWGSKNKSVTVTTKENKPEFRKRIRMRWRSSRSGSTTVNKWEWDQRNFETNIHMGITPPSPEKGHCCFPCEMLEAVTPIEPLWLRFVSMHDDRRNP
ncbi:stalk domain-containing protein [Paenibacillus sp. FSL M7-1455]|uniref:stalk domain-containing protein n=1 Tax=Paenibacillus sp. FSL M7-1455 TaxID=2975316 RepID=UPI0040406DF6